MNITKDQYKSVLAVDGVLKDDSLELLSFLFYSPQCEATAPQITQALGAGVEPGPANSKLGNLGKRMAKALSIELPKQNDGSPGWWRMIANGSQKPEGFSWVLREELAEALIELNLLDNETTIYPDVIPNSFSYKEGASKQVRVNIYERNPVARRICIKHHGPRCSVCGFDFGKIFGEIGLGFIHVHHLVELANIGKEYKVNPIEDLRPVCPNCHAMIHRRNPAYSIEEIRNVLAEHIS